MLPPNLSPRSPGYRGCLRASETDNLPHVAHHNVLHRKANYVFDVQDFGAVGDGVADDTIAVQTAIDTAAVNGGLVVLPPGEYSVDVVQIPGSHVGLRGYGSVLSRLVHRQPSGPVLDFSTWSRSTNYLVTAQYGGFSVVGLGVEADEIGVNLSRAPRAIGVVRLDDVAVRGTGGPCLYGYYLYLSVLRDCVFARPDGIDRGHDVPYVELVASNGTRLFNCGFRSLTADADAEAGMLRLTNSDEYVGHDLLVKDCWTEYPHPSEVLIYCENNAVTFTDWSWFDMSVTDAAASWVHFAGNGNTWDSVMPGTYALNGPNPYAGIKVTGSRNRIDGIKGYTGGGGPNVVLEGGAEYNVVLAAGQDSGIPSNSAAMVLNKSGNDTNVLFDATMGAAVFAKIPVPVPEPVYDWFDVTGRGWNKHGDSLVLVS